MNARLLWRLFLLGLAGVVMLLAAGVFYLQDQGITPRALAPYVERRAAGHNQHIVAFGQWLGATLRSLDRADSVGYALPDLSIGERRMRHDASNPAHVEQVASADEARRALAAAVPGDTITFAPGVYRIHGVVRLTRPGGPGKPIVVRAERPGSVVLELDSAEGLVVAAPYWTFENLNIRGACAQPGWCHHAFHVVGQGAHFIARNNRISDFNAHFKINGDADGVPDHGLIEGNTLTNGAVRQTASPVTPIDLVAANDWIIRGNLISDFIKGEGDRVSYGAFAKGAAMRTLFERNIVVCEHKLQAYPGQRVGLSFGGGGTGKPYCRDRRCITEHDQGIMRANLIMACSDAGVYLNSSAGTQVLDNTLLDTAGMQLRYPETSAAIDGNLVDGPITGRDGATLRLGDNRSTPIAALYVGWHPQRALFASSAAFDLRWSSDAPRRAASRPVPELCGSARPRDPAYGAFEDFKSCLAKPDGPGALR